MVPLFKVYTPPEIDNGLLEIIHSGQLTTGKHVRVFEQSIKEFLGAETDVVATNTYNSAANILWQMLALSPEDEVIASPMSCLASNQPLALVNCKIVWADIDPAVGSLCPDDVRRKMTKNTKAILHYHWCGYPGRIDEILSIAKEYGVVVVEDAIETFGATYKGRKIGNTGADFTLCSFQAVRLPSTIDGGALICKQEEAVEKAKLLRDYGIDRKTFRDDLGEINPACDISLPGYGATMNEVGGYLGAKAMKELPQLLEKQRLNSVENIKWLQSVGIKNMAHLDTTDTNPNYWVQSFLTPLQDINLRQIRSMGRYASRVHIRNDHYSVFKNSGKIGTNNLPGVTSFSKEVLSIPCGWWLNC